MSYSQNDWRSYSELYHGKWEWPNGKKYEGDAVYTDFMSHSNGYIQAVRLDDKELNPDNIKRVMR